MDKTSQVLVIGGGLAGLISAIHLAKAGLSVTLIEKETYPKHKVCGEYVSNEVLPYFEFLDIDLAALTPVEISKFMISTHRGDTVQSALPLGGFGISRYALDYHLWKIAKSSGVLLFNDQVSDFEFTKGKFKINTLSGSSYVSKYLIGAYGKRSVLDNKLKRSFHNKKSQWLAVKAHYQCSLKNDTVALHNFEGGYCGLSKVENNHVNACYLVNYKSFKKYKNIDAFQDNVMAKNPYLNAFFQEATPIFDKPLTISQINFEKKKPVENHVFMVGDTAGLIHPLCGNGMAMAIRSAHILSELLIKAANSSNTISRLQLEKEYQKQWNNAFSKRLFAGRVLQHILLNPITQSFAQKMATIMPSAVPKIIAQTHGKPIVC